MTVRFWPHFFFSSAEKKSPFTELNMNVELKAIFIDAKGERGFSSETITLLLSS